MHEAWPREPTFVVGYILGVKNLGMLLGVCCGWIMNFVLAHQASLATSLVSQVILIHTNGLECSRTVSGCYGRYMSDLSKKSHDHGQQN